MSLENNIKFNYILTSDLCSKVTDGTHDTPKEVQIGKKLVTSKNILGGKLNLDNSYFISIEDYNKINERSKVDKWDLLLYMIGVGVGEVALVKEEPDFAIKNLGLLKNKNETNAKWLYYYLKSPEGQYQIKTRVQGSTQPYIPLKELKRLEIPIPIDDNYLKYCIDVLDNIDKKIEVNEKINKNLNKLIRLLYNSWFVNFLPFQNEELKDTFMGKIPNGWEIKNLNDVCDKISETFDKKVENIVLINTSDVYNGKVLNHEFVPNENIKGQFKKLFRKNDILYSEIRPANRHYAFVDFESMDYVASTKLMVLRAKPNIIIPYILYLFLTSNDMIKEFSLLAESRSGTFPQITFNEIKHEKIIVAPFEVYQDFWNIIESLVKKQFIIDDEIIKLTQLRDTLLPKLMSGEIDVSKINCDLDASMME